ncbi:MAG: hydroxymyristoyl-ACP dehydratase [Dysgonamonadaceae bacterium]|jgi:3-hydroxyacyl-[acyl-carrier-protein] dehydratase|nr:hydroxymyristoyl-ACP dehydratase [Dysgonamonadaceae bacterium]
MLLDFYTLTSQSVTEETVHFEILINGTHFIYRAHFPGNPVTPGVCLIQICRELAEHYIGKKLFICNIESIKFLATINPLDNPSVSIIFSKILYEGDSYKVSAKITGNGILFAKLSMRLKN